MDRRRRRAVLGGVLGAALMAALGVPASAADAEAIARGKYVFDVADCLGCHTAPETKEQPLAGGRRLKTPFGVFISPNITPDPTTGIGRWTDQDFRRAMREGRAPDGSHYFPVFPYPSYTRMTDQDIADLKAYLFSLPPVTKANRPHEVGPPFGWRFLVTFWKWLYFQPGPFVPDPARSAALNRGAYIVDALGHCGECHTPRNALGALRQDRRLSGATDGPEGGTIPNITPDRDTGIGRWSAGDLKTFLKDGMTPDGDYAGAGMGEVIENSTSKLTAADLDAVVAHLRAIPAIANRVERKK